MPLLDKHFCWKWGDCPIAWNNANWTWSECQLVIEVVGAIPDSQPWLNQPWTPEQIQPEPWNPYKHDEEKRKRLIELLCKVKGEEYKESMNRKDFKITVNEVKLLVKKVFDIDLIVEVKDNKR